MRLESPGVGDPVLDSVARVDSLERSIESAELPLAVIDRARRYRARLGVSGVEIGTGRPEPVPSGVERVLAVGVLGGDQHSIEAELSTIRRALRAGGELWLIERTRPLLSDSSALDRWRRRQGRSLDVAASDRDVVIALRDAGWTICSIERVEVVDVEGVSTWWVDVVAADLAAQPVDGPSGEDDRDQRSE